LDSECGSNDLLACAPTIRLHLRMLKSDLPYL
jgi:hypothetical protein